MDKKLPPQWGGVKRRASSTVHGQQLDVYGKGTGAGTERSAAVLAVLESVVVRQLAATHPCPFLKN